MIDSSKRITISQVIAELETIKAECGDLAVCGRCLEHGVFERWILHVIKDHENVPKVVSFWETDTYEGVHGKLQIESSPA